MNCPVCQLPNVSVIHTPICPRCGTDLLQVDIHETVEDRLKSVLKQRLALEGEIALLKKKQDHAKAARARKRNYLIIIGLISFILWRAIRKPMVLRADYTRKSDSLTLMKQRFEWMQYRFDTLNNKPPCIKVIQYTYQHGDYLEKLGLLFFNNAKMGYQIGRDNGIYTHEQWKKINQGDIINIYIR
ncbi:MAG: hypothetical protein RIS64_1967 [Bacteroidota bacterium]|jgi:hypothetical protein